MSAKKDLLSMSMNIVTLDHQTCYLCHRMSPYRCTHISNEILRMGSIHCQHGKGYWPEESDTDWCQSEALSFSSSLSLPTVTCH